MFNDLVSISVRTVMKTVGESIRSENAPAYLVLACTDCMKWGRLGSHGNKNEISHEIGIKCMGMGMKT